ncbi:MAG: hypothetical protein JNM00_06065, partial [Flavobacteriales bacterium]|nr:hypothetical protein [Flavobacteriales bacterium]
MNRILLLFIALCSTVALSAQPGNSPDSPQVVQVSGIVLSDDSLNVVAFASVYRTRDMRGVWSDINGFFSLPALAGDTLRFIFIGHTSSDYVVNPEPGQTGINIVQVLKVDELNLPAVYVLPRPTPEKFREEFLALGMQTQPRPDALSSSALFDGLHEMTPDGSENFKRAYATFVS